MLTGKVSIIADPLAKAINPTKACRSKLHSGFAIAARDLRAAADLKDRDTLRDSP